MCSLSAGVGGGVVRGRLARLKEIVQQGPADVIIGKNGLTDNVLREIDRRLKEKGVIKVKALKSAIKVTGLDRKTLAKVVAEKLNALLLDVRGRTFVLYRPEPPGGGEGAVKRESRVKRPVGKGYGYSARGAPRPANKKGG
jgi:RNA-binding protein